MNKACLLIVLVTLALTACAKPKAELSVSKAQIKQGESVSVNWQTTNAKEVILNGERVSNSGTKLFQPNQTTTYELVGKRGKKEAKDSEIVTVEVLPAAPAITLTVDNSAILKGQKTRLRWSTQRAEKVDIPGLGSFGPSGDKEVGPLVSTTFTATAKGPGGEATASTRLTVTEESRSSNPVAESSEEAKRRFEREMKSIYFDFDSAQLTAAAKAALERNSKFLLQPENRAIVFRIEGNCDPRGSEEYNLALGDLRANAAKTYLISQGIDPSRMEVSSNGKRFAKGNEEGGVTQSPSWANDRRDDAVYLRGGDLLRR